MRVGKRGGFLAFGGSLVAGAIACSTYGENGEQGPVGSDGGVDGTASSSGGDGNACADVDADAKNCGRCGHDCLGGACISGRCQPFVVGSANKQIIGLVVASKSFLYMTGDLGGGTLGGLYGCLSTGCNDKPDVLANGESTGALASDGNTAYASFTFGNARVATVNADGSLTTSTTAYQAVLHLQTAKDGLWLTEFKGPAGEENGRQFVRLLPGSTNVEVVARYDPSVMNINTQSSAVTPTHLFLGSANTGEILACERGTNTFRTFAPGPLGIRSMEAPGDGDTLFWVSSNGKLSACKANIIPCASMTDLNGPSPFWSLTSAGNELIFFTDKGEVVACDAAQCGATMKVVATVPRLELPNVGPVPASADALAYYFVAKSGSDAVPQWDIMKVAK